MRELHPGLRPPDWEDLDPKIRTLAKSLWEKGFLTMGSCQGGKNHQTPYPWVTIFNLDPLGRDNLARRQLKKVLSQFNQENDTQWTIEGQMLRPKETPQNHGQLRRQQESANELARFIKETNF